MFNTTEKIFAVIILIVATVVAIVGYSFSKPPSPPTKIWFDSSGGDVIFDHAYHVKLATCDECHHNYEEGAAEGSEMNCRTCHYFGEARESESDDPTHKRFIGANCVECHKAQGLEPRCDSCHIRQGYAYEESGRPIPVLPESVRFETPNGLVVFNHELHISSDDVDQTCVDCHHQCKGGTDMFGMECTKRCRECHYDKAAKIPEYDDEIHSRYIGANCTDCHGADSCEDCHKE